MWSVLTSMLSFGPSDTAEVAPSDFNIEGQVVLILCGLIGSGKSTFAESLQSHFPQFRRCNQDDLGDRRRVEHLARDSLSQGLSVCIDRTNFNESQRSYWIDIAHEFPGTAIWVIVFDTPYEICAARLRERKSHPTIKSPEQGLSVLKRFAADFVSPDPHEGYQRILYVKPSDLPSPPYARADIAAVLQRVATSSPVTAPIRNSTPRRGASRANARGSFSSRGNSARGGRGSWGARNNNYSYSGQGSTFVPGLSGGSRSSWSTPPAFLRNNSHPAGVPIDSQSSIAVAAGEPRSPSESTESQNRDNAKRSEIECKETGAGDPSTVD
ncbi:uncharacterized protein LACBIDRAFT_302796 [Laccaria bicolor S238N-H82]|uniref:Predicted protein n=1 Tax=Laccaria bicolor (strain S238N-H82 / ATCC MYA-4686) TaxID=486041 RepID=B0DIB7_LACBS|nr:uncharacterized protein LACBIDRAFT_302796 [Laccaria bicolor S238N-H82]EDR05659.1 predicted protein [Laccaria bicolor S238N-H82]|eukprot:XP_001883763.1 predicted protein [Laccaria bicolor S238N-H82]